MMRWILAIVLLLIGVLLVICFEKLGAEDDSSLLKQAQALFKPLPAALGISAAATSAARVELGRKLFFDPRWTLEGNVSCATCHQPALYGTDALARSIGAQHRTTLSRLVLLAAGSVCILPLMHKVSHAV